jgi:uncharacterized protein (TIGR03067 family)
MSADAKSHSMLGFPFNSNAAKDLARPPPRYISFPPFDRAASRRSPMSMRVMAAMALLISGALLADDDKKPDVAKKVVGTWQLTKGVIAGNPMPEETAKKLKLELTDGKYKLLGAESPDEGTWKLHLDKKPFGMDIKGTDGPNKGKTMLCIFELDGDNLKVCYDLSGKKRPVKFESKPKTLLFLAEYKRAKKD